MASAFRRVLNWLVRFVMHWLIILLWLVLISVVLGALLTVAVPRETDAASEIFVPAAIFFITGLPFAIVVSFVPRAWHTPVLSPVVAAAIVETLVAGFFWVVLSQAPT